MLTTWLGMIPWELLVRIAVGSLLGGVIGYERDRHGRPAGLRTHMIVALASATFMVISTHFVYLQHYGKETAAALWLVGAIGMASGAGMYFIAIFVTLVGVFALTLLRRLLAEIEAQRDVRRVKLEQGL